MSPTAEFEKGVDVISGLYRVGPLDEVLVIQFPHESFMTGITRRTDAFPNRNVLFLLLVLRLHSHSFKELSKHVINLTASLSLFHEQLDICRRSSHARNT